ncbi:MAG: hypothetical protein B6241_03745 [Spirochaetaceae bacterium 4572_59]|nr:MAG: hypothetical protein B6241_03745 [Spirochaetaceae bacterium 4572_59]
MEKNMICISCPIGCHLTVSYNENDVISHENIQVKGNKCPRGVIYGKEEILAPKRVVTATCAIDSGLMDRIPVKSTGAIMKEEIDGLLEELYRIRLKSPVKMGDVIISDYNKSGIDIVTSRSLLS